MVSKYLIALVKYLISIVIAIQLLQLRTAGGEFRLRDRTMEFISISPRLDWKRTRVVSMIM